MLWGGKAVGEFQLMLWRGDGLLPDGWYKIFQAKTFAKPVTDGASAARRHFGKSVMLCLISVGDEPSPLHFRFQTVVGGFAKVSPYTLLTARCID